uniref:Putative secreted protein n=1 Tax=Panstrongylus lignarius TaxID=156445 RepID=A0A224Y5J4_9HEMI
MNFINISTLLLLILIFNCLILCDSSFINQSSNKCRTFKLSKIFLQNERNKRVSSKVYLLYAKQLKDECSLDKTEL